MTVTTLESNEARLKWREILDITAKGGQDIVITRYGKPVAAVIDFEDFVALQEELDDMRAARRAHVALEEWRRDPSTARPYAEVRAELIADGLLDERL